MANIKQFRYLTSNIAGYFSDSHEGGINFSRINEERKNSTPNISLPKYLLEAEEELRKAHNVKTECDTFISVNAVKSVTVNNYTVDRHNNGGLDTVIECVTVIYD